MHTREIEILLNKFFEAETNLIEEQQLRDFFLSENVPDHLKQFIPLFKFAGEEKDIQSSNKNLKKKLIRKIGLSGKLLYNRKKYWYSISGIAAAILLLFTIVLRQNSPAEKPHYTRDEILLARMQTAHVLLFASEKLNQGGESLQNLSKMSTAMASVEQIKKFDKGIIALDQGFDPLENGTDYLSKFFKINLLTN